MSYIVDRKDIFDALGIEADSKIVGKALKSFSGNIEAIKQVMDSLKGQGTTLNELTEGLKRVNEENVKFRIEQQNMAAEARKAATAIAQAAKKAASEQAKADKMASDRKKLLIQAMQAEKGSIEQLTAVNKVLQLQMAKLNATIPEQAAKYGQLQQAVVGNRNAMMQYAQAQMGVAAGSGKVKREFNGIQFQVTQLARELPALAYGPQMFIAAISNNFPMLQDEIEKVRAKNIALKASGEATVPVWKNITKSIFSLQTGIVVLITAYMLFHKQINEGISSLFGYAKAIDRVKYSQDLLLKAKVDGITEAQKEIVQLKALKKYTQDNNLEMDIRIEAANKLKKLYPDILGNYSAEEIITSKLRENYNKLTIAIYAKAKSDAAAQNMIEANKKAYEEYIKEIQATEDKLAELQKKRQELADRGALSSGEQTYMLFLSQQIDGATQKLATLRDNQIAILQENEKLFEQIMPDTFLDDLDKDKDKQLKVEADFDNRLQILKLNNEQELIKLQTKQREDYLRRAEELAKDETKLESEKKDELAELEAQQNIIYLSAQQSLNKKVIKLTNLISEEKLAKAKGDQKELIKIQKETQEAMLELENEQLSISKDISDKAGEEQVANIERDAKIQEEKAKIIAEKKKEIGEGVIDMYYDEADEAILAAQETTKSIINDRKLRNREIEKLQRELALQEARSQLLAVETMLQEKYANGEYVLTAEQREQKMNELYDLQKRLNELIIENSKKGLEDDVEKWKEWKDAVSSIVNEFFNLLNSLYENQLQVAKNLYESESKYAGVSVEQKLEAEKKLERKEKEVKKKQAIAQKAQTIFNIVMNLLAHTSKGALGLPEMIVAGAAMATAIATPIPAFEKGGKHKGGAARVSEKGEELFISKGKAYLTPKKEFIGNFPAGEFIPHDETQKMLANFAMTNNKEIIDMSKTNSYLSSIDRNTRNQTTVNIVGGYKIVVRNGITSKIRL